MDTTPDNRSPGARELASVVVLLGAAIVLAGVVVGLAGCGGMRSSGPNGSELSTTSTTPARTPAVSGFAPIAPAMPPVTKPIEASLTTPDGRTRTYRLYVPTTVATGLGGTGVPLLIALHGGIGSGTQFEENSGFDGLAQANWFIVAYPDGIGAAGTEVLRTWNGGNCCGPAAKAQVDDVAFVSALIDHLSAQYQVDPRRVFAAGHSNGGIMAYRLACELSSKIVGIGVQSAALGVDQCAPKVAVSLIHIHGTGDRNVPINGGVGDKGVSGVDFPPAINGVRAMATADGCPADPSSIKMPGNDEVTVTGWAPCGQGSAIDFLTVTGASHAWMGHPGGAPRLTGEPYEGLDSSATIWSFLIAHPRP